MKGGVAVPVTPGFTHLVVGWGAEFSLKRGGGGGGGGPGTQKSKSLRTKNSPNQHFLL